VLPKELLQKFLYSKTENLSSNGSGGFAGETRSALMGCLTDEGRHDCNKDLPAARVLAKLSRLRDEFPSLRRAFAAVLQKQEDIHKPFDATEFRVS